MRKTLLAVAAATLLLPGLAGAGNPKWLEGRTDTRHSITVYRSPTCGCCKAWIGHLRDHGFRVEDVVTEDLASVKRRFGVPPRAASCHTAVVEGRVVEGHVPAQDIKAMLAADDVRLLTVPGMPQGAPGMDYRGARKDPFRVWAIDADGRARVFREYRDY